MITSHIELILLITGIATCTLIIQAFTPAFALKSFYGKTITDEFSLFLARAGGIPITMIGLLLIWASFDASIRFPIIVIASIGKLLFITAILMNWRITGKGFMLTITFDSIAVILYLLYLLGL